MSLQRSFTSLQTCLWQGGVLGDEVKVRMKRGWRWDGSENEMKDYLTGTRGGERKKKRERANTNTDTPGPERANPERARKKKSGGRGTRNKTSGGGGRTEAPEPTQHSETYAYLGTHRTRPTWGGKNAWNRGPNGGLVDVDERKQQLKKGLSSLLSNRALLPKWQRGRSSHMGINGCSSSNELDARHVKLHQTTRQEKKTKPEGMYLPEAFFMLHVASKAWASARKGGFWQFETASRSQRRIYQGSERRQDRRDLANRLVTIRPTVSLYWDELLN